MDHRKLSADEVSSLTLSLSLLLHAGIPTADAVSLMAKEGTEAYDGVLEDMVAGLDSGVSLVDAMKATGAFPEYVCGLLEMGEKSGRTEETLSALSRYYDDRARLIRQVRSALTYPAILLAIMVVVIFVLLIEVLPIFDEVYADLGWTLTGPAGALLAFGRWLGVALPWILLVLAIVLCAVAICAFVPKARDAVISKWQEAAGDKGVAKKINTARMAQALSMGMAAGLPLEESLTMTAELMEATPLAQARCLECLDKLERGASLATAVRESAFMPDTESALLDIGMRSGTADSVMEEVSRRLTDEGEEALEMTVAKVEPTLVLVTSALVGAILLCVMLPLMNVMSTIG